MSGPLIPALIADLLDRSADIIGDAAFELDLLDGFRYAEQIALLREQVTIQITMAQDLRRTP